MFFHAGLLLLIFTLHAEQCFADQSKGSRLHSIEKCASCHQEVFAQWQASPHALAYEKLEEFEKFKRGNLKKFPLGKKNPAPTSAKYCSQCHYPDQLFETYGEITDLKAHAALEVKNYLKITSKGRKRGANGATGIDCIDCHVGDGQVYTSNSFISSGSAMPSCNPKKSNYLTNEALCIRCHPGTYLSVERYKSENPKEKSLSCSECHSSPGKVHEIYAQTSTKAELSSKLANEILNSITLVSKDENRRALLFQFDCSAHHHLAATFVNWIFRFEFKSEGGAGDKRFLVSIARDSIKENVKRVFRYDSVLSKETCSQPLSIEVFIPKGVALGGKLKIRFKKKYFYLRPDSDFPYTASREFVY